MIERVPVPPDLYRALVQLQTDFYATQGNAGEYWSMLAERTVAAAFCPVEDPIHAIVDRWVDADRAKQAEEEAKDDAEARSGDPFR